jgi:conjugative relaxase-like TrwC/TraI family protein
VTTLKGAEAGRYYTKRLPSYYLDGGDPPGRWWGRGAAELGLAGHVGSDAFLAVMAGRDPATAADLGRRYGETSVRGFDATFSAPKSVSVIWALGDDQIQTEVLKAHDRAVEAVLGWVQDHAHTRLRRQGHVVCVDTEGLIVGVFRQHTSRRLDPQIHTHAVIANRVRAPDGRWLALDARTIKMDQRTLSALYHANLRAELTARLGVEWRESEHGIAEIEGIPDEILAEFSQRTRDADHRLAQKLERFSKSLGREPSDREHWHLEREAVLDSRPAKPPDISLSDLRDDWQQRTLELGYDSGHLVRRAVGQELDVVGIDWFVVESMVARALESLSDRQSNWRSAEILRELATATPTNTTVSSAELTRLLESLTDQITEQLCIDISRPIPAGVELRSDGRPVTEPAVDRALTTRTILNEEGELMVWARRRSRRQPIRAQLLVAALGRGLSPGQLDVANAVAGHGDLELIVGPAGAGKTTALAAAVKTFEIQQRSVFGVAPTATAAEVLAAETGMAADTLDKLLYEHTQPGRPPIPEYHIAAGSTLVVDEAGTVSTPKLADLARLADGKQWRVVLVGDPRQFAAVGRGGMFGHLVDTIGAVELDEVHRFTQEWEKQASLLLRDGDPAALHIYSAQERIHSGGPENVEAKIIEAWKQARDVGQTVALMANSNDTVSRLNKHCQQLLLDTDQLDPVGRSVKAGDHVLHEGDELVTRRNDRTLTTSSGLMVKNRDHWTIQRIHADGSITVTGPTGVVTLPADYVSGYVELGYAQTSHASQGRTVDTALLLIDTPTDSRGVYTPMTRGRDANHAYVAIEEGKTGLDVLAYAVSREWADQPAIARQAQLTRDPSLVSGARDEGLKRAGRTAGLIDQRALGQTRERAPLGLEA